MSDPPSDIQELVRRGAAGDDDAFRRLVRQVHPDLRRWAYARTGDREQADEVVQRALIRVHRSLSSYDGRSRFTTWLYRIVANAAIDLHRSRRSELERRSELSAAEPAEAAGPDPLEAMHARRLAAVARDFFERLPPRQREVLELVDHQGLEPVEVARALGLKPVTVRASLFKARRAVREAMLRRYPELMEGYER